MGSHFSPTHFLCVWLTTPRKVERFPVPYWISFEIVVLIYLVIFFCFVLFLLKEYRIDLLERHGVFLQYNYHPLRNPGFSKMLPL